MQQQLQIPIGTLVDMFKRGEMRRYGDDINCGRVFHTLIERRS